MEDDHKYMLEHLDPIIGTGIVGIAVDDETFSEPCYALRVKKSKNGPVKLVWIMCDPEGNGPGHLNIEDEE